ncbi:HBR229Cp [Eremothecium sinecaudum]|uniref:Dynein heavy chain, cytoplasmic n=1 Tax=Eremothecium sinecaudum TaxID=45286 RepID=A0A109UX57_9SACH|nr:HBR229Cp [Eremothecium sinecaudum]AMD19130.1 HBR229Cp [Eremothecium sinecaudum]
MTEGSAIQALIRHVYNVAKLFLKDISVDLDTFQGSYGQKLEEWSNDRNSRTLFLIKIADGELHVSEEADVSETAPTAEQEHGRLLLIKNQPIISDTTDVEDQLQAIMLSSGSQFDGFKSFVNFGVPTMFDAVVSCSSKLEGKQESINSTRRKIQDLSLSLQSLQHFIEVPDLSATTHPLIKEIIAKGANPRNYTSFISDEQFSDTQFLNKLQKIANGWIKLAQSLTKLTRNIDDGSAGDEIRFWINLRQSLLALEKQISTPEVEITLSILTAAKRFHATVTFISDTGLRDRIAETQSYNQVMNDFPLPDLHSATSFERISESLESISTALKKIKASTYPLPRAVAFVEKLSVDIDAKLRELLPNIITSDYASFQVDYDNCIKIICQWESFLKEFTSLIRELMRKRSEKFIFMKIDTETDNLKDVLDTVAAFRKKHETLVHVLKGIDYDTLSEDIKNIYEPVLNQDPLHNNAAKWANAETNYNQRVSLLENKLVSMLKRKLDECSTSEAMFSIFEKYRPLMKRPRIQGAVREYQHELLNNVKEDLDKIRRRLSSQKWNNEVSRLNDIPPVSASIIWSKQLTKKLQTLTSKLGLILGEDWVNTSEGSQIAIESNAIMEVLNVDQLFESWVGSVTSQNFLLDELIFKIINVTGTFELHVNFDSIIGSLFKEVRNLIWMGFSVPSNIIKNSRRVRSLYPHAVKVSELLQTFVAAVHGFEEKPHTWLLLRMESEDIWSLISSMINDTWDSVPLFDDGSNSDEIFSIQHEQPSILKLEYSIGKLLTQFQKLHPLEKDLSTYFDQLQKCGEVDLPNINSLIHKIQEVVDKAILQGFQNMTEFITYLNQQIRSHLVDTVSKILEDAELSPRKHYITQQSKRITISPNIEETKSCWMADFQKILQVAMNLPKVSIKNFDIKSEPVETFTDIDLSLSESLTKAYSRIVNTCRAIDSHFKKWKKLELLWLLDETTLLDKMGSELDVAYHYLLDFMDDRKSIDTLDSEVTVGPNAVINIEQVYVRVSAKYDNWQRVLCDRLLESYLDHADTFDNKLIQARKVLENSIINLGSLSKTTEFIIYVDDIKNGLDSMSTTYSLFFNSQKLLQRLRFKLPEDFIHADQIESDLMALREICLKKEEQINRNREPISSKLEAGLFNIQEAASSLAENWSKNKPLSADIEPSEALALLQSFEEAISSLNKERESVNRTAKILLVPIKLQDSLSQVIEEVEDYKAVWSSVDSLWNACHSLLGIKWVKFSSPHVKSKLESLKKECQDMPPKVLQYKIFQSIAGSIDTALESMHLLKALKERAIKPRHWVILFKQLRSSYNISADVEDFSFTLEDVLNLNLLLNEVAVKKIIIQARNEFVLESSLNQIKTRWKAIKFELFAHSSGLSLVKSWDFVFGNCTDDLNMIGSMRNSPYFKVFEQEATEWESRLSALYEILLSWVEVQRQWMYLYGILAKKTEMKTLLPVESSKFSSLTSEYQTLLIKLYDAENVIEILHVQAILPTLKRMVESLTKIRKSLNDFLEAQRKLFPRFYFLGNEDLLQIIGAGDNFSEFSSHLSKLFSSVSSFIHDDNYIKGVTSLEGEKLLFANPIKVTSTSKLDEWMNDVDLEIKLTLATLLINAVKMYEAGVTLIELAEKYPFQVLLLTLQCSWTARTERQFSQENFQQVHQQIESELNSLTSFSNSHNHSIDKNKCEGLIVELMHLRSVTGLLMRSVKDTIRFHWEKAQKFYLDRSSDDPLACLKVCQSSISLCYGFEYIGIPERLIYTPLLDGCFNAMILALSENMGGCPFGPAGTGKTETIKALGQNLGRMVLVFNCDDSFDFQAMSRLLFGITQVGAWGCFDEFNRLEEKILSSVSTQIEAIQSALANNSAVIELLDKKGNLNLNTGIFITMNPGYEGRSELPENLTRMFREFSMMKPDTIIIAEALLTILGLSEPNSLAVKVSTLFERLRKEASSQKHYHFGLRALKGVLRNCSNILKSSDDNVDSVQVILRSLNEMVVPKLILEDEVVYERAIQSLFPGSRYDPTNGDLISQLLEHCELNQLVSTDVFIKKCSQFYDIQKTQQAIILAGSSGTGKTTVWKCVLASMKKIGFPDNIISIIDSKTLKKEDLYGKLDPVTFDWKDGIFTSILRKTLNDTIGSFRNSNIWIIFDSDLDPNYVETLNSVLDDNKILTLPNGERLKIPSNLHLIFEVQNLKHATAATVSRCGVIWFTDNTLLPRDILISSLSAALSTLQLDSDINDNIISAIQDIFTQFIQGSTLQQITDASSKVNHIMGLDISRAIQTAVTLLTRVVTENKKLLSNLSQSSCMRYLTKKLAIILVWSFVGDSDAMTREHFSRIICSLLEISDLPSASGLLDYDVSLDTTDWIPLLAQVPKTSLEAHEVLLPEMIIPTMDTIRHEALLYDLLNAGRPLILCGPPGSGKTMTLYNTLKKSNRFDVIGINFSKDTTVDSFLKTIEQHTTCSPTSRGIIMQPKGHGKQLVVFCDEINLPALDEYESQPVILFLRQLVEKKGFWNVQENKWVFIERIQIVGACNPSSHAGRVSITRRFSRHASIIMVDYPGKISMEHIYEVFYNAVFNMAPQLKGYSSAFTKASLDVYYKAKATFTEEQHSHYIFSPREITRWIRGIHYTIAESSQLDLARMIELWAHESLRIFSDRLVTKEEKVLLQDILQESLANYFPHQTIGSLESDKLLFSSWLSLNYTKVDKMEMYNFTKERLKIFAEEELDTEMTIYDDMIDNILRIDRILKQVQGHAILVGPNHSGKATITRFVAWMNGIKIVRPTIHRNFTIQDFDEFLKYILLKCGTESQRICVIIDESAILESSFLERMNTLLANSHLPGLFEAEEYEALLSKLSQRVSQLGLLLDTEQEIYDWFTSEISRNLHIVFNINDPRNEESVKLITSPALFNRCVINWIGTWSSKSYLHVANEVIQKMPLDMSDYKFPRNSAIEFVSIDSEAPTLRDVVANLLVLFHEKYHSILNNKEGSPSAFLNCLKRFQDLYTSKLSELEEKQRFTLVGLEKLKETVIKVKQLNQNLSQKQIELQDKEVQARQTLDKMLVDQNEAERKQEASVEIQKILAVQEKEISERRATIMADLELAEPAIVEAQMGVKNIKKQQFTELRSMQNPPEAVKTTLEAVCVILGYSCKSWKEIQLAIRKDEFVTDIVYYNTETMMTPSIRSEIENTYLSSSKFTYDIVNRASLACGPLYQWIIAQISYSGILVKVKPLKEELVLVEKEMLQNKARLIAADEMIRELQADIEQSKISYSHLIRDVEVIKTEMESVKTKVERSVNLIESLTGERERWIKNTDLFNTWNENLIGNCLLSSLYETYCGPHDQSLRYRLLTLWKESLSDVSITYEPTYTFISEMVDPITRAHWVSCGLPDNELFVENFYITMNSYKYPYIVDPTSTVVETLGRYYKNLIVTSFLDVGFVKQLENALRFGGIILIQDGEFFDPIISHLVAKEFRKAGGRLAVMVGEHEVDVSPEFHLIVHSKDPNTHVSSFVETRMAVVNFTVNKGSIEAQALQITLEKENPELQKKRSELLKLNCEYKLRLHSLENKLLSSLNESVGSILENDELIATLEQLKTESLEIETKIKGTNEVILQVEELVNEYYPLGEQSVKIFTILEHISSWHWFYHISINHFMECFGSIFETSTRSGFTRTEHLLLILYENVYRWFSGILKERDRLAFGVLLYTFYNQSRESELFCEQFWDIIKYISRTEDSSKLEFDNATPKLQRFVEYLIQGNPLECLSTIAGFFRGSSWDEFVNGYQDIIVASEHGVDATFKIQKLAQKMNQTVSSVALGSIESISIAEKELTTKSIDGGWLLLQNLQMSPEWTNTVLLKRLESLRKNPAFKVFMSCGLESNALVAPLLSRSYKFVYEGEQSVLTTVLELWKINSDELSSSKPVEKLHCKFLLHWFHSVMMARCRFAPIGFSKKYDFHDGDFRAASMLLDRIFSEASNGKEHVDPAGIPWMLVSDAIGSIIYGGKVSNSKDLAWCQNYANQMFSIAAYGTNFQVVAGVTVPLGCCEYSDYLTWFNSLQPDSESIIEWLQLPDESALHEFYTHKAELVSRKVVESVSMISDADIPLRNPI